MDSTILKQLLQSQQSTLQIRELKKVTGNLIIVGDIHGCLEQFDKLLAEAHFCPHVDTLVLAGDLVCKGPNSVGVLQRAIEIGAMGVMGNFEYTLLDIIRQIKSGELNPQRKRYAKDPMVLLAAQMPDDCVSYLQKLPHVLRIPHYKLVVLHGGVNTSLPLEEQNVEDLLNTRRLTADDPVSGKRRCIYKDEDGTPWAKLWKGPETIVFGHDARAGLQREPFAIGLDTGCVYGGELTAIVYPERRLVSVAGWTRSPLLVPSTVQDDTPPLLKGRHSCSPEPLLPCTIPADVIITPSMLLKRLGTTTPPVRTPTAHSVLAHFPKAQCSTAATATQPPVHNNVMQFFSKPQKMTSSVEVKSPAASRFTVQFQTLLALATAGHFGAVLCLMDTPQYADPWCDALEDSTTSVHDFCVPFIKAIAAEITTSTPPAAKSPEEEPPRPSAILKKLVLVVLEVLDTRPNLVPYVAQELDGAVRALGSRAELRQLGKSLTVVLRTA